MHLCLYRVVDCKSLCVCVCVCDVSFYERWKQAEAMHAEMLQFSLDDDQWEQDWAVILSIASQPGVCLFVCLSVCPSGSRWLCNTGAQDCSSVNVILPTQLTVLYIMWFIGLRYVCFV